MIVTEETETEANESSHHTISGVVSGRACTQRRSSPFYSRPVKYVIFVLNKPAHRFVEIALKG